MKTLDVSKFATDKVVIEGFIWTTALLALGNVDEELVYGIAYKLQFP